MKKEIIANFINTMNEIGKYLSLYYVIVWLLTLNNIITKYCTTLFWFLPLRVFFKM